MAKRFGNDRRIWIKGAAATFAEIKGQQSLGQDATASSIDISDKTSAPYGATAPGLIDMKLSFEVYPDLPDVNGYERLASLFTSQAAEIFQIRKNGSAGVAPADVEFECSCYVLGLSKTRNKNDVVKVTVSLGLAGVPTIDTLL